MQFDLFLFRFCRQGSSPAESGRFKKANWQVFIEDFKAFAIPKIIHSVLFHLILVKMLKAKIKRQDITILTILNHYQQLTLWQAGLPNFVQRHFVRIVTGALIYLQYKEIKNSISKIVSNILNFFKGSGKFANFLLNLFMGETEAITLILCLSAEIKMNENENNRLF